MDRRAGVKLHHSRMEGRPRRRGTRLISVILNSAFQFDQMSLLSRPDLATWWPRRAAQGMGGAEPRAASRAWRAPDLPRSEHRGRLTASRVFLRLALALLALFEAIAVAVHFEDVDVVCQPVEQRAG
jgi:hypothetical protein